TLSSLQHLTKDLNFGDLFFNDKPLKVDNDKATTETEAESMVSVMIQQDTSSIPLMTTLIIDLTSRLESPKLEHRLDSHGARLYTMEHLDIPHQVSKAIDEVVMDAVDWVMQASLRNRFRDLPEADMKEILHQRIWETDSYKTHEDHMQLYEALEKSMNPQSSNDEDIGNAHIPKVNLREDWWKPLEEERPATPEPAWSIPSSDVPIPNNNWASALVSTYLPPPEDLLLAQTGDIAMFMNWFCKRQGITELKPQDLKALHLNWSKSFILISKGSRPALSISKMKAAYYLDVGLEQMVPDQMWITEECKHTSDGDRGAVKTHMRILSVVGIKVFSMYGVITFQDRYEVQMIMCFNEIHKFSDGTLQQIDEALDYRVKEFKINRMNPGFNTRFWTRKDVDRSNEFMFAIQKWLKTRRIFCNLESFVGGRVRDGDYRILKRTK
nr:hypothetical protein [Tanacetum cinerariifolium]